MEMSRDSSFLGFVINTYCKMWSWLRPLLIKAASTRGKSMKKPEGGASLANNHLVACKSLDRKCTNVGP